MNDICHSLHHLFCSLPRFSFPYDKSQIPRNGLYIVFENGEHAHGVDRIVRVGTHTGNNQLRSRLDQHFVNENKDRSIFRKNIGRAILNQRGDNFLDQWQIDLTTREARQKYDAMIDKDKLAEMERQVTAYMRCNFSFAVFEIEQKEQRIYWESRIISTISACKNCRSSAQWLGLQSPVTKIRESGLWLVKELYGTSLSENDFESLRLKSRTPVAV